MRIPAAGLAAVLVAACGGGGGGGTPPATLPARLTAPAVEFAAGVDMAQLVVELQASTDSGAALAEVVIELPAGVTVAAGAALQAAQPVVTLDGKLSGDRYKVLVGDARNSNAAALPSGSLFRLQLVTTAPRQRGTHTLRLLEARIAARDGAPVDVDPAPSEVPITIR
ncbi:MAG: hypothetical protein H6838_06630 [Planctomycetes bacterium]|nr:hypothetical protein [Planctomycetota bacterium]MCB9885150.1 hypothetical protein [Planctomycetota bacterium]